MQGTRDDDEFDKSGASEHAWSEGDFDAMLSNVTLDAPSESSAAQQARAEQEQQEQAFESALDAPVEERTPPPPTPPRAQPQPGAQTPHPRAQQQAFDMTPETPASGVPLSDDTLDASDADLWRLEGERCPYCVNETTGKPDFTHHDWKHVSVYYQTLGDAKKVKRAKQAIARQVRRSKERKGEQGSRPLHRPDDTREHEQGTPHWSAANTYMAPDGSGISYRPSLPTPEPNVAPMDAKTFANLWDHKVPDAPDDSPKPPSVPKVTLDPDVARMRDAFYTMANWYVDLSSEMYHGYLSSLAQMREQYKAAGAIYGPNELGMWQWWGDLCSCTRATNHITNVLARQQTRAKLVETYGEMVNEEWDAPSMPLPDAPVSDNPADDGNPYPPMP